MAVFPSTEWFDAFSRELSAHPEAGRVARALDGTYRFVIEPAGPLTERHAYDLVITFDEADGASVTQLDDPAEDPRLTVTASYERWRQLIRGELNLAMAVMLRRVRVAGDLSRLQRQLSDTQPLVDALQRVETTWPAPDQ